LRSRELTNPAFRYLPSLTTSPLEQTSKDLKRFNQKLNRGGLEDYAHSLRNQTLSAEAARRLFFIYAAVVGLSLSTIFHIYTESSITRVFFISAASFGALSLYGYTTQRDLSPIGSFLMMGLIGLIIAMVVNMFLKSTGLDFVISAAGVLIFAGLTAWDTQKIKEMFDPQEDGTAIGRKAVMGALTLYLDFINLFLFLLRIFGQQRS